MSYREFQRSGDGDGYAKWERTMRERRARAGLIVDRARSAGLEVDLGKVLRNYEWFVRWDEGRLATGYLIKRCGVKRRDDTAAS